MALPWALFRVSGRTCCDDFLSWLETQCPDFEMHQVKLKGAGLRLYLGTKTDFVIPDERIRSEISQLENLLTVPRLIPLSTHAARKKRRGHLGKS